MEESSVSNNNILQHNEASQKRKASSLDDREDNDEGSLTFLYDNNRENGNDDLYKDIQEKKKLVHDKKNIAIAIWYDSIRLAEITTMRGNFWKCSGFSVNGKCFLYPEEVLYLVEKNLISIYDQNNNFIDFNIFYEIVMKIISLQCYLTYSKLKTLEYVVMRHNKVPAKCFYSENDIKNILKRNSDKNILDNLVSYNIYKNTKNFSKKNANESPPVSYIVIVNDEYLFNGKILLKLFKEANEVPIIIAAVMNNSNVILEEFSDAMKSLNWDNVVAVPPL